MRLVNEFSVDAPLDVAWSVLTDIPKVVECIPGAELDRVDGDDYHAHVAIKVGPVGMTLAGMATLLSRDDEARQMVVRGNARDRKGNGSTEATVRMVARDDAGRSIVTVTTDLELSGRIAQFGTGVITQVSNRIIGQFVARLNAVIAGDETPVPAGRTGKPVAPASVTSASDYPISDRTTLALTALAGVALGLAIGRSVDRLSCPPRRG
ncbi:SRPBCC family protein [Mycolicibacterium sp. YH-1]|uniref:SRPBCC family protein n=1 Tax=Mycolicibacterium sp. YH-1 TaxID=2908837 RepID=UPI001F4BD37B|nr:SRPBCC family protein [Mycolicibacterium sp. YH-1]UNB50259.1 SRPBCC family protein [Mycolicibacterium sp. YH-1]